MRVFIPKNTVENVETLARYRDIFLATICSPPWTYNIVFQTIIFALDSFVL